MPPPFVLTKKPEPRPIPYFCTGFLQNRLMARGVLHKLFNHMRALRDWFSWLVASPEARVAIIRSYPSNALLLIFADPLPQKMLRRASGHPMTAWAAYENLLAIDQHLRLLVMLLPRSNFALRRAPQWRINLLLDILSKSAVACQPVFVPLHSFGAHDFDRLSTETQYLILNGKIDIFVHSPLAESLVSLMGSLVRRDTPRIKELLASPVALQYRRSLLGSMALRSPKDIEGLLSLVSPTKEEFAHMLSLAPVASRGFLFSRLAQLFSPVQAERCL